jgi:hypothetical protein
MIMYRNADLRVPCAVCRVEQPLARMELSPRGGHWCWRCQLSAQIAEHAPGGLYGHAPRPLSRLAHGAALTVGVGAGVLLAGYLLLYLVAALTFRC